MTPEERKAKYPRSKFDPLPGCKHCGGTGERFIKKLNTTTFCICLFVDHAFCEELGIIIGNVAKKELAKLRSNHDQD